MNILSAISVIMGFVSALIIAIDIRRYSQKMKIMNSVWILTALWGSIFALCAYFWFGRQCHRNMGGSKMEQMPMSKMESTPMNTVEQMGQKTRGKIPVGKMSGMDMTQRPYWQSVTLSTLHCGAGCTLADLIGEWFLYFVAITIMGSALVCSMVVDYFLALLIGIYFQYTAIKSVSMVDLKPRTIISRAFKADVLSLTSWQIGMYGFMAIAIFWIFPDQSLNRTSWTFWFMMQIAMLMGFVVAFPVNILLIKLGVKRAM